MLACVCNIRTNHTAVKVALCTVFSSAISILYLARGMYSMSAVVSLVADVNAHSHCNPQSVVTRASSYLIRNGVYVSCYFV